MKKMDIELNHIVGLLGVHQKEGRKFFSQHMEDTERYKNTRLVAKSIDPKIIDWSIDPIIQIA